MELNPGICGVCSSENEVVNSEDSKTFWEIIFQTFKDEIDNLSDLESKVEMCPTCIFQTTVIDSKKDAVQRIVSKEYPESADNCGFCEENVNIFRVQTSGFLKKFDHYAKMKKSGSFSICASCYYVLQATFNIRQNLMQKLSESKKSSSSLKDSSFSVNGETSVSEQKPKRNSTREKKGSPSKEPEISNDQTKEDKNLTGDRSTREAKKENRSRHKNGDFPSEDTDITEITSERRSKRRKNEKSVETSTSNEQLTSEAKQRIPGEGDSVKDSPAKEIELVSNDNIICSTPKRGRSNRNQKLEEASTSEVKEDSISITESRVEEIISSDEESQQSRSKTKRDSTSRSKSRGSGKRKASESPENVSESKDDQVKSSLLNDSGGVDLSRILQFVPLSKGKLQVNEEIKQDIKFYQSIPFVKLAVLSVNSSDTASNLFDGLFKKKSPDSSKLPKSSLKKTPPIKIKLKPMKKSPRQTSRRESLASPSLIEEIQKKKVVVKVARIDLSLVKEEDTYSKKTEHIASEILEVEEKTPVKKKKKVHFNDTPTIIITGDEFSDLDSVVEDEEFPRKRIARIGNTPNYKVVQNHEADETKSEESIEIEDDEDTEIESEVSKKKEDTEEEEDCEITDTMEDETSNQSATDETSNQSSKDEVEAQAVKESNNSTVGDESKEDDPTEEKEKHPDESLDNQMECVGENNGDSIETPKDKTSEEENSSEVKENEIKCKTNKEVISNNSQTEAEETNDENKESVSDSTEECEISEGGTKNKKAVNSADKELECNMKQIDEETNSIEDKTEESLEKVENECVDDDLRVIDECNEEIEEDKEKCELDKDKVKDKIETEAAASEDFGSLIDEVQKCLTSTKDFSDDEELVLHASTEDIDEALCEKNDSISKEDSHSTSNENLKTVTLESETSIPDKGSKRRISVEDDSPEKSAKKLRLSESLE